MREMTISSGSPTMGSSRFSSLVSTKGSRTSAGDRFEGAVGIGGAHLADHLDAEGGGQDGVIGGDLWGGGCGHFGFRFV